MDTLGTVGDRTARREDFAAAGLSWYGLDDAWQGRRWLGSIVTGSDGVVQYGILGHGDPAAKRPDSESPSEFINVVTMAKLPKRPGDAGAMLDPTTRSSVAAIAGVALVDDDWPWQLDRSLRPYWLAQQTDLAYAVAERLEEPPWFAVALPVNGLPAKFHYRESDYGWVLAGETATHWLGAYGRGLTPFDYSFIHADLERYAP